MKSLTARLTMSLPRPSHPSKRKGGVTHNMLDDIHNHWKRAEAVRIKCLGVPTLDMDNVCFHLEDKSGGKIVYTAH
ncbi:unnamed protein product [Prunus armeniaca]|uniref:CRM domain-containing protein n=1 Tax=Prunus armeniaca TaxID=36596 RepID=A0A6J5URE3_PRUAR|nr:unnamed protein product [Prunus armeniaca]